MSLVLSLGSVAELGVLDMLSLLFLEDTGVFLFSFTESILSPTFGVAFPPFSFLVFLDWSSSFNLSCSIFHAYSKYMRRKPSARIMKSENVYNINIYMLWVTTHFERFLSYIWF